MADEACVVRLARNRERTQTENRSNEQPQNQPRTIILIPHDIMISNIKFHLYDISYFQPIRDHLSFSWCCLDWLSTPPFIESYCYFTVPELSTGAQLNLFYRPWIIDRCSTKLFLQLLSTRNKEKMAASTNDLMTWTTLPPRARQQKQPKHKRHLSDRAR